MKKVLTYLAFIALLTSTAMSDTIKVEMGAGSWSQDTEGTASYRDNGADGNYKSAEKDYSQMYVWIYLKHPIPILPNLRLEYVELEDHGAVSGEFKEFDTAGVTTTMTYDTKQYDIIPYYNILDNTAWTTLDIGLDIKVLDTDYNVAASAAFTGYSDSETLVLPLLYVRARVEIPATNIGLETDVKYLTYGSSNFYDFRAKIDYTLDFIPVIQPALEVGYRIQKIDLDEDDVTNANIDMEYAGLYAGLMLRF